ncbi:DUF4419 domain-containing protein [Chloroflexia bacterium SDU3-3]|nr:DUF4419 domain-containing protein [Chloroflexia bacterium SDU3-3]
MIAFAVSDVALAPKPLPTLPHPETIRATLAVKVEQIGPLPSLVICDDRHALVSAARCAFYDHRPLVLSPDIIWFCIAQGFANHMAIHAEELRERFVDFSEKKTLVVERSDFRLGQENPWEEVFSAFSQQIAASIGEGMRRLLVADFSTTGAVERAATEVLMMDAFQAYFEYEMRVGCGIPSITLLGTPADWQSVRQRALALGEYGLEWWVDELRPILDELVASAEGKVDRAFWQSFFHYRSGSLVQEMTGWIQVLFPYMTTSQRPTEEKAQQFLKDIAVLEAEEEKAMEAAEDEIARQALRKRYRRKHMLLSQRVMRASTLVPNTFMTGWSQRLRASQADEDTRNGPGMGQLPSAISSAPVRCEDVRTGEPANLRFVAGLFGVAQDAVSGALTPAFGWAVVYDEGGAGA